MVIPPAARCGATSTERTRTRPRARSNIRRYWPCGRTLGTEQPEAALGRVPAPKALDSGPRHGPCQRAGKLQRSPPGPARRPPGADARSHFAGLVPAGALACAAAGSPGAGGPADRRLGVGQSRTDHPPAGPGPSPRRGGASFRVCCRHRRQRATMLLYHRDEDKLAAVSWSHAHPSRVVWTLQWHLHALDVSMEPCIPGCCALRCLERLAPHSTSAMARAAANLGWMRLCTSRNRSIF